MKRRTVWLVFVVLAAGIVAAPSLWCAWDRQGFSEKDLLVADAGELKATVVSPHLDAAIDGSKNVLWCGSFQLVWNDCATLVGGPLVFQPPSPTAAAMNRQTFAKADMAPGSYLVVADFVRNDPHGQIGRQMAAKFPNAKPRLLPDPRLTPRPQDIVGYAYLFKDLPFAAPFEALPDPIVFQGTPLRCFGIDKDKPKQDAIRGQVQVLDYRGPDDFVVELTPKGGQDRIILAKVAPAATLAETIAAVHARSAAPATSTRPADIAPPAPTTEPTSALRRGPMIPGDVLKVPKLNFDVTRRFDELEGLHLVPPGPNVANDLIIASAMQRIRFQMDEKGVKLESESHMIGCSAAAPPRARIMVFDKPFLILLQQTDAPRPYFALWVANPDLLVKQD